MSVPLFYLPLLHNQCIPQEFQTFTQCIDCGLSTQKTQYFPLHPFPFSSKEASFILQEMVSLSLERNTKGQKESHVFLQQEATPFTEGFEDANSLRNFMATEESTQQKQTVTNEHILMDCQKVLLLAHSLEEDHLNILEAQKKLHDSNATLQKMLNAEKEDISLPPEEFALERTLTDAVPIPTVALWQQIIEASAPFLPEKAVFITAEKKIIKDIYEIHSPIILTNEELLTLGIAYTATNCYTKIVVPFWHLTKHKRTTHPWLNQEITIIMVISA